MLELIAKQEQFQWRPCEFSWKKIAIFKPKKNDFNIHNLCAWMLRVFLRCSVTLKRRWMLKHVDSERKCWKTIYGRYDVDFNDIYRKFHLDVFPFEPIINERMANAKCQSSSAYIQHTELPSLCSSAWSNQHIQIAIFFSFSLLFFFITVMAVRDKLSIFIWNITFTLKINTMSQQFSIHFFISEQQLNAECNNVTWFSVFVRSIFRRLGACFFFWTTSIYVRSPSSPAHIRIPCKTKCTLYGLFLSFWWSSETNDHYYR